MLKKLAWAFCITMALAVSSFAAAGPFTGTIATDGPDLYADGTPVLEGERYGFVYFPNGQTFQGFHSDGTLVDPVNNHLRETLFTANADSRLKMRSFNFAGSEYAYNTVYLVLFDTRKPDGTVGGMTNGWGVIASVKLGAPPSNIGSRVSFQYVYSYLDEEDWECHFAKVTGPTVLPPSLASGFQIDKIDVTDTEVLLTVTNSASCAYYLVSASEQLGDEASFTLQDKSKAVSGSDDPEQPLVLRYPKAEGGRFFKVNCGTLMDF